MRVQDVAGISGSDDPAVLAWATANSWVVLTHDLSTMVAGPAGTSKTLRVLLADRSRARLPPDRPGN